MQKGGFGYVFVGTYDTRTNPDAARKDLKVVIKLPNTDPDSIRAFQGETLINKKIASFGGIPGVAEFLGTVDLSPIERQLPPGIGSKQGLVWSQVQGKTLDTFFDRGGGMSPILASTLDVRDTQPVKLRSGAVVYLKINLCKKVLGESLLPLVALHEKGIIHRDLKPRNIMLVENDRLSPFRIIDFGSAVEKGKKPFMDDYTEIYAPPEAPDPDFFKPESYDIYTVGITALRVLMPSLVAGEKGIQTLGLVTTREIPSFNYDLRAWCEHRATTKTASFDQQGLNAECKALLDTPDLLSLLSDMLQANAKARPSARECLQRLGPEWEARMVASRYTVGENIPRQVEAEERAGRRSDVLGSGAKALSL
eukprot:194043-Hanusia_phi.AAC.2